MGLAVKGAAPDTVRLSLESPDGVEPSRTAPTHPGSSSDHNPEAHRTPERQDAAAGAVETE